MDQWIILCSRCDISLIITDCNNETIIWRIEETKRRTHRNRTKIETRTWYVPCEATATEWSNHDFKDYSFWLGTDLYYEFCCCCCFLVSKQRDLFVHTSIRFLFSSSSSSLGNQTGSSEKGQRDSWKQNQRHWNAACCCWKTKCQSRQATAKSTQTTSSSHNRNLVKYLTFFFFFIFIRIFSRWLFCFVIDFNFNVEKNNTHSWQL